MANEKQSNQSTDKHIHLRQKYQPVRPSKDTTTTQQLTERY
jgi:hypothetical protein